MNGQGEVESSAEEKEISTTVRWVKRTQLSRRTNPDYIAYKRARKQAQQKPQQIDQSSEELQEERRKARNKRKAGK
jgi:uncharacterized short protein YbdD (DUF466 family)